MVGNCEDCIHFEVCSVWNKKFIDLRIKRQSVCEHFKNKADFVEVVRCCDCKYCKAITDREGNGVVYCDRTFAKSDVDPTDFCSYGERK